MNRARLSRKQTQEGDEEEIFPQMNTDEHR